MGDSLGDMQTAVLRELGREWNRIIWSILFVIAVAVDIWAALYPSYYPWSVPWSGFVLGLFTGIAFSGLAITLTWRRNPPSPPEAARAR